jgi:preprotein translocase subunit YajC
METTKTKAATAIQVGDRVVESDGAFFTVTAIADAGRSLVFSLANSAGYMIAPTQAKVSKRARVRVLSEAA